MPLYEYECPKDGRFELVRKFSDPPLAACPTCGGPVEKLLSAPAIQFKGSGWYITDYARKGAGDGKETAGAKEGAKEPSKEGGKESAKDGGSGSTPSESKGTSSDSKPAAAGSADKK